MDNRLAGGSGAGGGADFRFLVDEGGGWEATIVAKFGGANMDRSEEPPFGVCCELFPWPNLSLRLPPALEALGVCSTWDGVDATLGVGWFLPFVFLLRPLDSGVLADDIEPPYAR
jgi:hypothetical protein